MTVLAGAITYVVVTILTVGFAMIAGLIMESVFTGGSVPVVIIAWIVNALTHVFGLLVLVFWVYAMFQGNNPIEAFGYQMWE